MQFVILKKQKTRLLSAVDVIYIYIYIVIVIVMVGPTREKQIF